MGEASLQCEGLGAQGDAPPRWAGLVAARQREQFCSEPETGGLGEGVQGSSHCPGNAENGLEVGRG